ncbi:TPR repeat [Granulicella sibirica]|uniref:TPR repeat n=2 Tax=Granulicella sibirica TaxID=2479048 RepID=A0A4Q0T6G7_9BACT|nr:TPR repeat [Granulicella sibirica]
MHSFQFGSAIQGFNAVLEADPKCAIAEWGIALSSWGNPFAGFKAPAQVERGLRAVEEGRAIGASTDRERAYLEAVAHLYVESSHIDQPTRVKAYEHSMAAISAAYPEDTEATIFYALALAADADPTDKTYANQLKAGALLEALFVKYPDHPGLAHYLIHAYDEPALAPRAAEAARRYGTIAPSTPHALHMPSHTFTRIGDWQSSIDTNIASAAAAQAEHQPADVLHASDYMVYAYLQTAQDEAAKRLVESSATTFAAFDPAHATGAAPASAAFFARAAIPARYCLERQAWADAAKLEPLSSPFPYANAISYFTRGLGAARLKDGSAVREAIKSLEQIRNKLTQMKDAYWANQIDIERQELVAMLSFVEGHQIEALTEMRLAAEAEDKTETATVTPGPLKPAREMLGELLLQQKRPAEALREFQATLNKEPNRFWSLYGAAEAAKRAGDREKADLYFQKLLAVAARADQPGRPELAEARAATRRE